MKVNGQLHEAVPFHAGKRPRCPLDSRLGGRHSRPGSFAADTNFLPPPESELCFLGSAACGPVVMRHWDRQCWVLLLPAPDSHLCTRGCVSPVSESLYALDDTKRWAKSITLAILCVIYHCQNVKGNICIYECGCNRRIKENA
jgi:hypothetical protein